MNYKNITKGKLEQMIGRVCVFGGLALSVYGCPDSVKAEDSDLFYIGLGVILFGIASEVFGRIKYWYYNR